jgi:hypothetical protein
MTPMQFAVATEEVHGYGEAKMGAGKVKKLSSKEQSLQDVLKTDYSIGSDLFMFDSKPVKHTKPTKPTPKSKKGGEDVVGSNDLIIGGDLGFGFGFISGGASKKEVAKPKSSSKSSTSSSSKKDEYVSAIDFDTLDKYM